MNYKIELIEGGKDGRLISPPRKRVKEEREVKNKNRGYAGRKEGKEKREEGKGRIDLGCMKQIGKKIGGKGREENYLSGRFGGREEGLKENIRKRSLMFMKRGGKEERGKHMREKRELRHKRVRRKETEISRMEGR